MEFVLFSKFKKIIFYTLAVYGLLGFIILPLVLKPQLIKIVEENTNAHILVDSVYFNPFIFKLALSDVQLQSLENSPLVTFKTFLVNLEPTSLFYGALHIKTIQLKEPKIHLTYNKDKTLNLLNIIKKSEEEKAEDNSSSSLPRLIVDSVEVSEGGLFYKDHTQKNLFEFSFGKIGFHLSDIDTSDLNASDARVRFYATLGDGGFVDFKTKVVGFEPLKFEGSLDFEASKLYTEWKYVKEELNLEVADGKISFHTEYSLNLDDLNATTIENLNISLNKLRVKPKNEYKDVLNLETFYVQNGTIKPFTKSVDVEKIALKGLLVKVKRQSNGEIDWIDYVQVASIESDGLDENVSEGNISTPWDVVVRDVAFEKISLAFEDRAIKPNVSSDLNELNIYAQDVTLLGEVPFSYQMNMLINRTTQCASKGTITHKRLDINSLSSCKDFDVARYRPYIDEAAKKSLKVYDVKLQNSLVGFEADSNVRDMDGEIVIKLNDANMSLDKFRLDKRSSGEKLVTFSSFGVQGVKLNTQTKEVSVAKTTLKGLNVNATRYKNGKLNLENLVVAKASKKTKTASIKKEKAFDVKLKRFALKNAKANFTDKALEVTTKSKIDRIYVNLYNLDIKKGSWLSYNASMRVNKKGYVKANGKLRHTPLKQKGSFDVKNVSLTELTPYLQESHYVDVDDGRVSLKGKTAYSISKSSPDLRVQSSFRLDSLFVNDSRDDSLVFSLNEVDTKEFTLELSPNRFYVNEVDVSAFYVNARIDENKSMNFSELAKVSAEANKTEELEVVESNASDEIAFPVNVLKVNVTLGSAKFADYSIPIKFATHIHHLDGVIYSISNTPGETTYVNIAGEVDKYGSTRLKGSIDSSNPKAYTDLAFNFKNLELSSLSGYSASFAGHEIDSGKLYLDLGYDILNSELHGSNAVMMKKVVLGREVDDENVTVLPLGFVLGLLEDNDGVIDIDMPVEGNVDDPDFKYGTLVLKTIGNLISKAVLSPFKFLGSVMGIDAEKLEYLEFEAGSGLVSPPEREKLDQIAKIMSKKPKILLALSGVYDEKADSRAMRLKKLIDVVMLKSGLKNRKEHESAMSIDLLEEIYEDMKDDDGLDELRESLEKEYKDEEFTRNYHNALLNLCIEIQTVTGAQLLSLADVRANAIVLYLVQEKFIDANRLIKGVSVKSEEDSGDSLVKMHMQIEVK